MRINTTETPAGSRTVAIGEHDEVYSWYLTQRNALSNDPRYTVRFTDGATLQPRPNGIIAPSQAVVIEVLE
jgi:hypothetical protein